MPNWCNNFIEISGEESKMKPICDYFANAKDDDFVMSYLIPEDEDFNQIKESGEFILSPYVSFYGTKWDFTIADSNFDSSPTRITLSPPTAWSPPEPFCQRLSKKYGVDVSIKFSEGGNDFAGQSEYSNGEEVMSETYSYREGLYYTDNETFWYEVESDIEWLMCENESATLDDVLGSMYPFITDKSDIETLTEIYNGHKTTGE